MKKFTGVIVAALVVLLVSCVGLAKEQIVWWYEGGTPEQEKALRTNFVDAFNKSQDKYELVVRFDPNMDSNVRTAMLAGAGPDLVMTAGVAYAQQYVKDGYLLPLDKYAEMYGWNDRYLPVMIDLGTFDGHLYTLPKTYESMIIFYNKTMFEENGWKVPTNRNELETVISAMLKKGIIPSGCWCYLVY